MNLRASACCAPNRQKRPNINSGRAETLSSRSVTHRGTQGALRDLSCVSPRTPKGTVVSTVGPCGPTYSSSSRSARVAGDHGRARARVCGGGVCVCVRVVCSLSLSTVSPNGRTAHPGVDQTCAMRPRPTVTLRLHFDRSLGLGIFIRFFRFRTQNSDLFFSATTS